MSIIKGLQNFVYKTLPERLKKEALLLHPQKSEELLYCAKYWQDCAAENILKPLNRDYVSLHGQLNGINHFFITGANPQNLSQKFMNTGLMPKEMISLSDMEFKRLKPIEVPITAFRCIGEKPDFFSEYKLYQKRFNIKKGDIINMREYAYATSDITYARGYLTNNKGILYEIEIPAGARISVKGIGINNEIVFPRSSRFECLDTKRIKNNEENYVCIKLRYILPEF